MSDLTERAAAALEGVTPGPWTVAWPGGNRQSTEVDVHAPGTVINEDFDTRDGIFIAAARSLVPELVAALVAAEALTDELQTKFSYIAAGCVSATREELIRRITADGPLEYRAGHWLSERIARETDPLRAQVVAAEGRIEKARHILGSGYGDWRDAEADLRAALSVPVDEGTEK